MIERSPATHVLRVEVPLCLSDPMDEHDEQAIKDSIGLALSLSRAAVSGRICDTPEITLNAVAS